MVHKFLRKPILLVAAVFMAVGISSAEEGTGWKYDESSKTLTLSGTEVDWSYLRFRYNWNYTIFEAQYVKFDETFDIEAIPESAFTLFSQLKEIAIPECVTSIKNQAFQGCGSLKAVTFPTALSHIGCKAFDGCSSIQTVILPASLNEIENEAFNGCSRLKVVKVLSDETSASEHCILLGGSDVSKTATGVNVFPKGQATLVYDEGKTWIGDSDEENLKYYFDDIVTSTTLSNEGWSYNAESKTITLKGNKVAWHELTDYASIAEKVDFDETFNVATIPNNAFLCFTKLTDLEKIPDCVTSIGNRAFYECGSLSSVELPAKLKSIGSEVFRSCGALSSINFPENGLEEGIGNGAFYQCSSLAKIVLPVRLKSIENYTFYQCSKLSTAIFPEGLQSIGIDAFRGCSLTEVSLPNVLQSIGNYAFSYCSSLSKIEFSKSLQSIGEYAFYKCNNLTDVIFPEEVQNANISKYAFYYSASNNVTFPKKGLESIGEYAFSNSNITSASLPAGLKSIGLYAFSSCHNLTTVEFSEGLESIGRYAFKACGNLTTVKFLKDAQNASIGECAFINCKNLSSVTFPDNGPKSIGNEAFRASGLTSISLPAGLKSIGNMAFFLCNNLSTVEFPEGLENIGYSAFENCPLESIELHEGLWKIQSSVFGNCTKLKSVTLPASLTYIGDEAFNGCSELQTVTLNSNGTPEEKHVVYLGNNNNGNYDATGKNVFPQYQATLIYNSNITKIGEDENKNLLYYFNGYLDDQKPTSICTPLTPTAPAQYYDLGGQRVNMENHKGVVVKVQEGKSELMMVK